MSKRSSPPTPAQHAHANRTRHRDASGRFKPAPPARVTQKKLKQPSLDQDAGGGYNANDDAIQD